MAYAALISLLRTIEQILLFHDPRASHYEKQNIESLQEKLGFLLQFFEQYSSRESDEMIASLERRIRDEAYQAQDFADLYLTNLCSRGTFSSLEVMAANYLLPLVAAALKNDTFERHFEKDVALRCLLVKLATEKVDSVVVLAAQIEEKWGLNLARESDSRTQHEVEVFEKFSWRDDFQSRNSLRAGLSKYGMIGSSSRNTVVFEFENHLMQIKEEVLNAQQSKLKVISIVGMGGIGKTTLANCVYTDPSVVYHFDIRALATVSQSYCVRDILLGVLDSMGKLTVETRGESEDQLKLHVYKNLKGRRYLLVIDDIWDTAAWDDMKMVFPDDNMGSRIVLTTRLVDVAAYTGYSDHLHRMSLLSDDESWTLLRAKIFGTKPCPHSLQGIGKKIAQKCHGLPLSIVVIGGLLSKINMTLEAWHAVAANVTSFVSSSDDNCLEILKLSYNYLPQHLKACFLYLGVFPEDYEISVSKLVKLWVAEGFLKHVQFQTIENTAEKYLEELVDRNLILISKKNSEGKIKTCRMHDLLLAFCVKEAKYEKFLQVSKWYASLFPGGSLSERHLSIHPVEAFKYRCFPFYSMPSISFSRSLICIGQYRFPSSVFLKFKLLRVLDAIEVEFLRFPHEVLELQNLRYIALTCEGDIPGTISKLWNLQTLIIDQYFRRSGEIYLPLEIWKMAHLRHIQFVESYLIDPAANFDYQGKLLVLEDLQSLSGIWNLRFTKEMLQRIPNIKRLVISYDSLNCTEKASSYYQLENLVNLHQLKALKIRVSLVSPTMFKFDFPPTLETLTLSGCGIPWHDLAIVGSLPNLKVLKLKDHACLGTEWEPSEREFSQLKLLVLEELDLMHWKVDYNYFPSLQRLILHSCHELVEIPSEMGESQTLSVIELHECKASVLNSAQKILELQQSYGNDGFQVVVHSKKSFSDRSIHTTMRRLVQCGSIPPESLDILPKDLKDAKSRWNHIFRSGQTSSEVKLITDGGLRLVNQNEQMKYLVPHTASTGKEYVLGSMSKLLNLETMIMNKYARSWDENLAMGISKMPQSRQVLLLDPLTSRFNFYGEHLAHENLHFLSGIWNLRFSKEILKRIPNITKLDISYDAHCCREKGWSYYQFENLIYLHQLKALKIRVIPIIKWFIELLSLPNLKFAFPNALKTLSLGGWGIPWPALAIVGSLPNLEVLKLTDHACLGTEWEPNEGEFPQLKVLVLEVLDLMHWKAKCDNFPSLQHLILRSCYELEGIPSGVGEILTLEKIELHDCNYSVLHSAMLILEKQQSLGNDCFQLVHSECNLSSHGMKHRVEIKETDE
ncbi:putative late blight resistance protein homolog R1A-3 [Henckelia pumila]|uniref:putative late blight resistance protein homolog R1A-3 n=1 Tax=Henckelia pumila TaxID=405737 RepID=UPI003C6E702C